jgi:hypothetical protein
MQACIHRQLRRCRANLLNERMLINSLPFALAPISDRRTGTDFTPFREFRLAARLTLASSRTLVTNLFSSPVHRFFVPSGTKSPCAQHRHFPRHSSPFGALRYCACIRFGRRDEPLCQYAWTSAPRLSSGLLLPMQPVACTRRMRQDV